MTLTALVEEFLSQKRIAVMGVSQTTPGAANSIYCKLRDTGYEAFAVNPNAETVEGDPCYPDLKSIPNGVNGVVIATRPEITEQIVRECADLNISYVWIHRNNMFGKGSFSEKAVDICQENDITVIPGACPMMFCEPVDVAHKCMRWLLDKTGKLPKGEIVHG